jgi:hypothetical protein
MDERIDSLTDEQAQHALLRFYELLPADYWQGEKLTYSDLEYWQEEIDEAATPDIQPFLEAVEDESNASARGRTARLLLVQFADYEPLRPYVEQAVEEAETPQMVPLPVVIVAATVVLAAMPKEIEYSDAAGHPVKIKLGQLESAAAFVKSIADFLKNATGFSFPSRAESA